MITQQDIYRFFETMSLKFLKENIPILNNLIHDYEGYHDLDELERNIGSDEQEEDKVNLSDEEN